MTALCKQGRFLYNAVEAKEEPGRNDGVQARHHERRGVKPKIAVVNRSRAISQEIIERKKHASNCPEPAEQSKKKRNADECLAPLHGDAKERDVGHHNAVQEGLEKCRRMCHAGDHGGAIALRTYPCRIEQLLTDAFVQPECPRVDPQNGKRHLGGAIEWNNHTAPSNGSKIRQNIVGQVDKPVTTQARFDISMFSQSADATGW